jgi:Ser/Thr protein kinase RdoA (MazF antagonist)
LAEYYAKSPDQISKESYSLAREENLMRYGLSASNHGDFADRASFPAQSSVLDEEALFHRIVPQYQLPSAESCVFFSRGDSDVYQISTVGPTYYLKIYRPPDPVEKGEAEGRLVTRLLEHGASVVPAVPRHDGAFATAIAASEGTRVALVFEAAPPGRLDATDEGTCCRLGEAVARLHAAGDAIDGSATNPLEASDLLCFAERLAHEEDYAELQELKRRIIDRLRSLPGDSQDGDIGWCHGDLGLCNIRCREDGSIVFFDFGDAGFIPRAAELVRVRGTLRKHDAPQRSDELWATFEEAYASVRPVPSRKGSEERWELLGALRKIRWVGGVMGSCPLRMGTENFNPGWVRSQLKGIRRTVAQILEQP